MKLGDLQKIFDVAERIYHDAGNEAIAAALKEISSLCDGRESMTVTTFANRVASRSPSNFDGLFQNVSGYSIAVSELRNTLCNVHQLCASAGAKTAAKDLQAFSDLLKPYSDAPVDKAGADIKRHLDQAKPADRSKATGSASNAPDGNAVMRHLTELREAGTDHNAFDLAFKKLKASKSVKLPDLAEIAHQFSLSVTAYKSKAAAYSDIEKAFVRQARFENKLR